MLSYWSVLTNQANMVEWLKQQGALPNEKSKLSQQEMHAAAICRYGVFCFLLSAMHTGNSDYQQKKEDYINRCLTNLNLCLNHLSAIVAELWLHKDFVESSEFLKKLFYYYRIQLMVMRDAFAIRHKVGDDLEEQYKKILDLVKEWPKLIARTAEFIDSKVTNSEDAAAYKKRLDEYKSKFPKFNIIISRFLFNKANCLFSKNEHQGCINAVTDFLKLNPQGIEYEEMELTDSQHPTAMGRVYTWLGKSYWYLNNHPLAIDSYRNAITHYESAEKRILAISKNQDQDLINVVNSIGITYRRMSRRYVSLGQLDKAREYAETAVNYYATALAKMKSSSVCSEFYLVKMHQQCGAVYLALNEITLAKKSFTDALQVLLGSFYTIIDADDTEKRIKQIHDYYKQIFSLINRESETYGLLKLACDIFDPEQARVAREPTFNAAVELQKYYDSKASKKQLILLLKLIVAAHTKSGYSPEDEILFNKSVHDYLKNPQNLALIQMHIKQLDTLSAIIGDSVSFKGAVAAAVTGNKKTLAAVESKFQSIEDRFKILEEDGVAQCKQFDEKQAAMSNEFKEKLATQKKEMDEERAAQKRLLEAQAAQIQLLVKRLDILAAENDQLKAKIEARTNAVKRNWETSEEGTSDHCDVILGDEDDAKNKSALSELIACKKPKKSAELLQEKSPESLMQSSSAFIANIGHMERSNNAPESVPGVANSQAPAHHPAVEHVSLRYNPQRSTR